MEFDDFLDRVQRRANLATPPEALRAARAMLAVLGQVQPAAAERLAEHVPTELAVWLRERPDIPFANAYDLPEFYEQVGKHEGRELPEAAWHARAVASVLCETVNPVGFAGVCAALPATYGALFECEPELAG